MRERVCVTILSPNRQVAMSKTILRQVPNHLNYEFYTGVDATGFFSIG